MTMNGNINGELAVVSSTEECHNDESAGKPGKTLLDATGVSKSVKQTQRM